MSCGSMEIAFVSVFTASTVATAQNGSFVTARRARPSAEPSGIRYGRRVTHAAADSSNNGSQKSSSAGKQTVSTSTPSSSSSGGPAVAVDGDNRNSESPEVILDENVVGFCSIDPNSGKRLELSTREKEMLFLDAMQSYFRGTSILSNDEFDTLKEELMWQGSNVVTLNRDEYRFLDAAKSYEEGKPIMEDAEFDALKKKLFEQGSIVAIQRGPRCNIERKITFSDVIPDKKRTFALFVPAGLVVALTWLSLAFELTPLRSVDPVVSLLIGSPIIFLVARTITGAVVPNGQIMVGDCPSCGRRTHVLFGDVLNQKGFGSEADVKCGKCKAELKVEKDTCRMILLKEGV